MATGGVLIGCGFVPTQVETQHAFDGGYIKNCQVVRTTGCDGQVSVEMVLSIYTDIARQSGWAEPKGGLEAVQFTTRCGQRLWSVYPLYQRAPAIGLWLLITLTLFLALAERRVEAASPDSHLGLRSYIAGPPFERYHPYGSHIRIEPRAPTPSDVIRIIVSGEWPNVCVPRYQSHQIIGNVIRIEAEATFIGMCIALAEPGSWSFTVEVGPLPIGLYTVEVYLVDASFWWRPPPILYDTTSFMVATERLYLPVILRSY